MASKYTNVIDINNNVIKIKDKFIFSIKNSYNKFIKINNEYMFTNEYYQILNIGSFSEIKQYSDNLLVITKNSNIGFVDINLNLLVHPQYKSCTLIWDQNKIPINIIAYDFLNKAHLLDINTAKILLTVTNEIYYEPLLNVYVVSDNYKYYLVNTDGEKISDKYNRITKHFIQHDFYFVVQLKDKYGLMTTNGKILLYPSYDEYSFIFDLKLNLKDLIKTINRKEKINEII